MNCGRRLAARRMLEGQRSVQPGPQLALQVQRAAAAFLGHSLRFLCIGRGPRAVAAVRC